MQFFKRKCYVFTDFGIFKGRRLNVCKCQMFDIIFEAQVLCFCGFWFSNVYHVKCMLMHILNPKDFIFVDFEFSEVKRVLIYIEKCSINICMKNPTKGIE